jgi:hypothetical protein
MYKKRIYIYIPLAIFFSIFLFHITYLSHSSKYGCFQNQSADLISGFKTYISHSDFYLGYSYSLAGSMTAYAVIVKLENRRCGGVGIAGGISLLTIVYGVGCFFTGCCGSPLLPVYLSFFGAKVLGIAKPFIATISTISVIIGYIWISKKVSKTKCA